MNGVLSEFVTNIDCDYATLYIFTIDYWYSIVWLVLVSSVVSISLMVFENDFNNGVTGHI